MSLEFAIIRLVVETFNLNAFSTNKSRDKFLDLSLFKYGYVRVVSRAGLFGPGFSGRVRA